MNIYAEGSNLIYGQIGHFFVITFFIAAIASCLSYFLAVKKSAIPTEASIWLKFGRIWYIIHAFTVIGAAAIVLIMIHQHIFEYKYIWQH